LLGFRRTGQAGECRADVPNPRRTRAGSACPAGRAVPGQAQVISERAGQAQLGVAGDDQPGPAASGLGLRIFGMVHPRTCLNRRKVCSRAGAAQERLPAPVQLISDSAGGRGPQPYRLGLPVAGQVIDLEADQGAFDDGQAAVVVQPGRALGLNAADDVQAGFARLVTDRATFAWLCDVFVDAAHRGRGLGVFLAGAATSHPDVAGIRQVLMAEPGRSMYRQRGFGVLLSPERWMERPGQPIELSRPLTPR